MAESSGVICSYRPKRCVCPKVRTVGSKGAVLVIIWTYLVTTSLSCLYFFGNFYFLPHASHELQVVSVSVSSALGALCAPLLGLVASAYFRRHKIVCASFWLMWSGAIASCAINVLLNLFDRLPQASILCGLVFADGALLLGFAAFAVNSISFGLDQMPDASSEQITAFIHWDAWSVLAGLFTASILHTLPYCTFTGFTDDNVITSMLAWAFAAFLFTLMMCSSVVLRGWMIVEPQSINPLRTIIKVLRFAAKHKIPVRRSAFTYWEPGIPSRIDLGKSKYGGPFTNEEVEDVKTFFRMLLILSCISIALCSNVAYTSSFYASRQAVFGYDDQDLSCRKGLLSVIVLFIPSILLSIPVYDVVIYPLRCVPSMLQRAGLAQTLTICGSLIVLATTIAWYLTTSPDQCVFSSPTDNVTTLSVDSRWVTNPLQLGNTVYFFFFFTAVLEFVCAQAPYNLRGLLTGLLHSIMLLSTLLGEAAFAIWKLSFQQASYNSMCSIWFYLFTTITATLGCVIWCFVAKWYKKREREEVDMCRIFAENYYDH